MVHQVNAPFNLLITKFLQFFFFTRIKSILSTVTGFFIQIFQKNNNHHVTKAYDSFNYLFCTLRNSYRLQDFSKKNLTLAINLASVVKSYPLSSMKRPSQTLNTFSSNCYCF